MFWTSLILSVCVSGKSHMKVGNHNYFLSWREPWHKFEVRWRRADLGLHTPHSQTWPTSRMLIRHGLNSSPPPLLSSPLTQYHYFQDWDWFNGRNFCRDRCMDLVSFNTPGEFEMFSEIMKRGRWCLSDWLAGWFIIVFRLTKIHFY